MHRILPVLLGGLTASQAAAQELIEVDLELVLAVDISYSVDEDEARRQREGYVAALAHPDVISAIEGGPLGRIAVTYVEWAVIASEADALDFAAMVAAAPLERGHYTAIGAAIADSVRRIETNQYQGYRRLIDISGDGPQNQGMDLGEARAMADEARIIINGLPVITDRPGRWVRPVEVNLDVYFSDHVVTGPGAFVLPARTADEFRTAILRKMTLEIAGAAPAAIELAQAAP
mgnify:CR=1 FL=1